MIKDPFGVSMGGSGLVALPIDMMKFGYFIAHRGLVLGRQLLSPSYIDMAVSPLTASCVTAPLPSEAQGYGCNSGAMKEMDLPATEWAVSSLFSFLTTN